MAARLPVITTAVGDAERIVLQEQTGFVVNGVHFEDMADRMIELALSPATRKRLGTEARALVERKYNYRSLPTRLLSVFHDFAVQNRRHQLVTCLKDWLPAAESNALSEALLLAEPAA